MAIKFYNVSSNTDSTKHSKSLIFTHTDEDIIINLPNHSGTLATSNGLEEAYRARYGTNNLTFILTPSMATRDNSNINVIKLIPGEFKTSASFLGKHDTTIWEVYKNNSIIEANKVASEDNALYKDGYTLPLLENTGSNYLVRYKFRSNNIESSWSPAYSCLPLASGLLPITASASEGSLIPDITISELKGYGEAKDVLHDSTVVEVYDADKRLVYTLSVNKPKDVRNFKLRKDNGDPVLKGDRRYTLRIVCRTNIAKYSSTETTIELITPKVFISKPEVTYLQRSTDRSPIDFMDSTHHGLDRDPIVKVPNGRGGTDQYYTAYAYGYDASIGWPRYIFTIDRDPVTTGIDPDKVKNFYLKYKLYVIYKGEKIPFRAENNFGMEDPDGWNTGYNLKAILRRYGGDNSDATIEKLGYKLITYKGKKLTPISIPPYAVLNKLATLTGLNREDINLTKFKFQIAFRYEIDGNYSDVVFEELKLSYAKTDIYYFAILDRLDEKKFPAIVTSGISLLDYDPVIGTYGSYNIAWDAKYVFTFYNQNGEYSIIANAIYYGGAEASKFFNKNGVNYKLGDARTKFFKENIKPFIPTTETGGYDGGVLRCLTNISDEQWKEISKLFTPDADTVTVDSYAIVKDQYTSLYRSTLKADMLPSLYKGNVIERFYVVPDKRFDHLDDVDLMVKPYNLVKYDGTEVNISKVEIFITNNGSINGKPKNIRLRYFSLESNSYGLITASGALYANKKDDSIFGKLNMEYGDVITCEVVMNTEFGIIEQSAKDTVRIDRWTIEEAESWFKSVGGKQSLCIVPTRILFQPEDREIDGKSEFRIDVNDIAQHGCSDLPGSTILDILHIEVFKKPNLNTPVIRADLRLMYNDKFQWTKTGYGWYNKCLFVADRDKEKLKDRITFGSKDSTVIFYTNSNYSRGTYSAGDKSDIKFNPGDELIIKMNMQEYPEEELAFRGGMILKSYTYIRSVRVPELEVAVMNNPKFKNISNNPEQKYNGLNTQFFNRKGVMGEYPDLENDKFILDSGDYLSKGFDNNTHVETIWEFRDTHHHAVTITKHAGTDDLYSLPMSDAFVWYADPESTSPTNTKCVLHPNGRYMVQVTYVNGSGNKTYVSGNEAMPLIYFTDAGFNVKEKPQVEPSVGPRIIEIDNCKEGYGFQDYILGEIEVFPTEETKKLPINTPTGLELKHTIGLKPVPKDMRYTDNSGNIDSLFPLIVPVIGIYKYSPGGSGNDLREEKFCTMELTINVKDGKLVYEQSIVKMDIDYIKSKVRATSSNLDNYWNIHGNDGLYIKYDLYRYFNELRGNALDKTLISSRADTKITGYKVSGTSALNKDNVIAAHLYRTDSGKTYLRFKMFLHGSWGTIDNSASGEWLDSVSVPEPFYIEQNVEAFVHVGSDRISTGYNSDRVAGKMFKGLYFDRIDSYNLLDKKYKATSLVPKSFLVGEHAGLIPDVKPGNNTFRLTTKTSAVEYSYNDGMFLTDHTKHFNPNNYNAAVKNADVDIPYIDPKGDKLYVAMKTEPFLYKTGNSYVSKASYLYTELHKDITVSITQLDKVPDYASYLYNQDSDIVANKINSTLPGKSVADLFTPMLFPKPVKDTTATLDFMQYNASSVVATSDILVPNKIYNVTVKMSPFHSIFFIDSIIAKQTFKAYKEPIPTIGFKEWIKTEVDTKPDTKVPFIVLEASGILNDAVFGINYDENQIEFALSDPSASNIPEFTISKLKVGPYDLLESKVLKHTDFTYNSATGKLVYKTDIFKRIKADDKSMFSNYNVTIDRAFHIRNVEPIGVTMNKMVSGTTSKFTIFDTVPRDPSINLIINIEKVVTTRAAVEPSIGPKILNIASDSEISYLDCISTSIEIYPNEYTNNLETYKHHPLTYDQLVSFKPVPKGESNIGDSSSSNSIFPLTLLVTGKYKYSSSGHGDDLVDYQAPVVKCSITKDTSSLLISRRVVDTSIDTMYPLGEKSNPGEYWGINDDKQVYIKSTLKDYIEAGNPLGRGTGTSVTNFGFSSVSENPFGEKYLVDGYLVKEADGRVYLKFKFYLHASWPMINNFMPDPFYIGQEVEAKLTLNGGIESNVCTGKMFKGLYFDRFTQYKIDESTNSAISIMPKKFIEDRQFSDVKLDKNAYSTNVGTTLYHDGMTLINHGKVASMDGITYVAPVDPVAKLSVPYLDTRGDMLYLAVDTSPFNCLHGTEYVEDPYTADIFLTYRNEINMAKIKKVTDPDYEYEVDPSGIDAAVENAMGSGFTLVDAYVPTLFAKPPMDTNTRYDMNTSVTEPSNTKDILEPNTLYSVQIKSTPIDGVFFKDAIVAYQTFKTTGPDGVIPTPATTEVYSPL